MEHCVCNRVVHYDASIESMAEVIRACETGYVVVSQPKDQSSIVTLFEDMGGTVEATTTTDSTAYKEELYNSGKTFETLKDAIEYLVKSHCSPIIRRVTGRDDVWSHIYVCHKHPPCAECERCRLFQSILDEYSMHQVFDLVDGKTGSWYGFDNRQEFCVKM